MRHVTTLLVPALMCLPAYATITNQTTQQRSALGASTVTIAFPFLDNDYLSVFLEDTTVTPSARSTIYYGSGAGKYTVTGGDPGTTVVMGTQPTSSQRVVVQRSTSKIQPTDYADNEAFPFEDHEEQMDRTIMVLQELGRDVGQKLGLSTASSYSGLTIPDPSADRFLVYNHGGTDFTLAPTTTPSSGDMLRFDGSAWSTISSSIFAPASTALTSISGTAPISTSGTNISISQAGIASNGYLSSTDWNTFNNKQSTLALGNLTSGTTGVSVSGGTGAVVGSGAAISVQTASGSQPGLLSSTDWTTFNNKQASGNYITSLTGDVTASGPGAAAATLATVTVAKGGTGLTSVGGASSVPQSNGSALYYALLSNSNISSTAAVSRSKLATDTANTVVVNNSSGAMGTSTIPGLVALPRSVTTNIDWSLSNAFYTTISSNTTFTFSNVTPGQTITVATKATGSFTTTYPSSVAWAAGTAPTQTASKTDACTFINFGSSTLGSCVQNFTVPALP